MRTNRFNNKVTLEDLLEVKRQEVPDESFWLKFEQDFQSRRLKSIFDKESFWERIRIPLLKTSALVFPLMAFGLFIQYYHPDEITESGPTTVSNAAEAQIAEVDVESFVAGRDSAFHSVTGNEFELSQNAKTQFVMDSLTEASSSTENQKFRKVMYSPSIQSEHRSDLEYIRDSFQQSGYQLSAASLRSGRNF